MLSYVARVPSLAMVPPILAYRSFISPRKGFRCAQARVHGKGHSCSDIALHAFQTQPINTAISSIRTQFAACKQTNAALRAAQTGQLHLFDLDPDMLQRIQEIAMQSTDIVCCDCDGFGGARSS